MRRCPTCALDKNPREFSLNTRECKGCQHDYYLRNRAKRILYQRKYHQRRKSDPVYMARWRGQIDAWIARNREYVNLKKRDWWRSMSPDRKKAVMSSSRDYKRNRYNTDPAWRQRVLDRKKALLKRLRKNPRWAAARRAEQRAYYARRVARDPIWHAAFLARKRASNKARALKKLGALVANKTGLGEVRLKQQKEKA